MQIGNKVRAKKCNAAFGYHCPVHFLCTMLDTHFVSPYCVSDPSSDCFHTYMYKGPSIKDVDN